MKTAQIEAVGKWADDMVGTLFPIFMLGVMSAMFLFITALLIAGAGSILWWVMGWGSCGC